MNGHLLRLLTLDIRREHDLVACRQRARRLAEAFGFDALGQTQIATAVSEITRNAHEYAGGGVIEFAVETNRRRKSGHRQADAQTFVITVRDTGPGMPPPEERRSSAGLGLGLPGSRRLMDDLEITSRPGGTTVTLRKAFPTNAPVLTAPQLQATVDRITAEPPSNPLQELQRQNQELLRALDDVRGRQEDLTRVNQELAETNTGVLALYDELETLHRVGVLLASQLDLRTLLQAIIDATTELTDAAFGAFFFRGESDRVWRVQAVSGPFREALADLSTNSSDEFFGANFVTVQTAGPTDEETPVSDCGQTGFAQALGGGFVLKSCLTIPVASETEFLGAMVFGSGQAAAFNERSERIVSSIAAQAVVGIEKARLFESVQNSSAAKDRFLAMLSHELRTPLNPVLAVVSSLVSDGRLPMEARQDLDIVLRNVRLEARLIDDLLDFNRIINGKLHLHREPLDLHVLIRNVMDICAEDIAVGGHQVDLSLEAPHAEVLGDAARLQQVFWNILKNAVKFTPTGGHISVATTLDQAGNIAATIADTGVGIEPMARARIFDAFEQGSVGTVQRFGGLGLGLAISKAFVDLHEGAITAASAGAGQGTQITVRLPSIQPVRPLTPAGSHAPPVAAEGAAAGTLLLVDDHADTLKVMSRLLARRGYKVLTAVSCQTALEVARQQEFDLLVSDVGLPDGSGLTLLPRVRRFRQVPAIALSGYGMEEDVQQSQAAGYEQHLTKPIDFPLLALTIGKLLAEAGKQERLERG